MFESKDFALRLAQLRIRKKVSAREMSLSIGMNPGYIQNIESGKASPSMEIFLYICDYLEITPSAFFDLEEKDPAKLQALLEDLRKLNETQIDAIQTVTNEFLKK